MLQYPPRAAVHGESVLVKGQTTGLRPSPWHAVVWLLLMVLGTYCVVRAEYVADLSAFLPRHTDDKQQLLIEQVQSGVVARTLMIGIEGGSDAARAQASRDLAARLRSTALFTQVSNGDRAQWAEAGEWLFQHRYRLSPLVDAERFSASGLRDAIENTVSLLGTPAGSWIKPLLTSDPTAETQAIAESLLPAQAPRMAEGVWMSRTGPPRALLMATVRAPGGDLDAQAQALSALDMAFSQTRAAASGLPAAQAADLRLRVSGPPRFAVDGRSHIETEAHRLALWGAGVMGLVMWLALASWRAMAAAVLPVLTGLLAGTAVVSLVFGAVHGMTLGFGSTLIGEGVDYAIYYLIQARQGVVHGQPGWLFWRRESWPTVRLGLWTSLSGFAALAWSGFPGVAQLGVFSMAGLGAAAWTTRYVLPLWMPDGVSTQGGRRWLAFWMEQLVRWAPRLRPLVWLLTALAVGALVAAMQRTAGLWRGGLSDLSPISAQTQTLDEELRTALNATDSRTLVVVQGVSEDEVLQRVEAVGARLDTWVSEGRLLAYDAVTKWLPSSVMQRARQAHLPDRETLQSALDQALVDGPIRAARLGDFVTAVQAARESPIIRHDDLPPGVRAVVDTLLTQRPNGAWVALLPVSAPTHRQWIGEDLHHELGALPGVLVIDAKSELDALYARYLGEALWQSALGGVAVLLLLAFYLRRVADIWAVCQPLGIALVWSLAAWAWLPVPLGILHLIGLLLVLAVGSNYALFFVQWRRGMPDSDTLASLLLANLTTVLSFGLLALSAIPALSAIGQVVAPGAFLSLVLSAVLMRR